jgi:NAD(P)-dependent dehydrogenase (short-subunit alcohol dehydrogenase family)
MPEVCVVVGAGPQLGTAIARRFGRGGYRVILVARGVDRLVTACASLSADGVDAHWRAADASDPEALAATVSDAAHGLGPVDVLVYNAATTASPGSASAIPLDTMRRAMAINVLSPIAVLQSVFPGMRERGRGTVLTTGGSFGLEPSPDYVQLGTGKAALRNLTFSVAKEVAPWGIHAAMITIGAVIASGTDHDPDGIAERYWDLHRQNKPWEREVQI